MRKVRCWRHYSVLGMTVWTQDAPGDFKQPYLGFRLVHGSYVSIPKAPDHLDHLVGFRLVWGDP